LIVDDGWLVNTTEFHLQLGTQGPAIDLTNNAQQEYLVRVEPFSTAPPSQVLLVLCTCNIICTHVHVHVHVYMYLYCIMYVYDIDRKYSVQELRSNLPIELLESVSVCLALKHVLTTKQTMFLCSPLKLLNSPPQ